MPRFKGYTKTKRALMAGARRKGLRKGSKSYGAYVYGTLGRVAKKVKGRKR